MGTVERGRATPPPNEGNVSLQSSATSPCPEPPSEGRKMLFFTQGGAGRPRQRTGGSPGKSPSQHKGWIEETGPPGDPPLPGTVQNTTPFRPSLRVARIYEPSGHPLRHGKQRYCSFHAPPREGIRFFRVWEIAFRCLRVMESKDPLWIT